MNREQWLTEVAKALEPIFAEHDYSLPPYRVSCSWPARSALSAKNRRIGECWSPDASADATTEMIISMGIDDHIEVTATLVHEMVHAAVGVEHGHKAPFKRCATAVGLIGKMTATTAGPELTERLNAIMVKIGPYPHARIDASTKPKQTTRLVKAQCGQCGYTVRVTRSWIEIAIPICPVDHIEMTV